MIRGHTLYHAEPDGPELAEALCQVKGEKGELVKAKIEGFHCVDRFRPTFWIQPPAATFGDSRDVLAIRKELLKREVSLSVRDDSSLVLELRPAARCDRRYRVDVRACLHRSHREFRCFQFALGPQMRAPILLGHGTRRSTLLKSAN